MEFTLKKSEKCSDGKVIAKKMIDDAKKSVKKTAPKTPKKGK